MIKFKQTGDFSKSIQYMGQLKKGVNTQALSKYAEECVSALSSATPVNTGLTANSWYYKIENKGGSANINFYNSNSWKNLLRQHAAEKNQEIPNEWDQNCGVGRP